MHAALTDALFWLALGIIVPAGYAVAFPAMYWAMKREQKRGRRDANPPPSLIKIRETEIISASRRPAVLRTT
jgi:hypothetical protein